MGLESKLAAGDIVAYRIAEPIPHNTISFHDIPFDTIPLEHQSQSCQGEIKTLIFHRNCTVFPRSDSCRLGYNGERRGWKIVPSEETITTRTTTSPSHERVALLPIASFEEVVDEGREDVPRSHRRLEVIVSQELLTHSRHAVRVVLRQSSRLYKPGWTIPNVKLFQTNYQQYLSENDIDT